MDIKQRIKTIGLSLLMTASSLTASAHSHTNKDQVATQNTKEYKYIPASKKDFLKMAQKAVKILKKSSEDNEFSHKLCSFYDEIKEKEDIDLNDPIVRKTFLAYKKIVKYNGLSTEQKNNGEYNEQSYLLGIDAKSFHQLTQIASDNMRTFCNDIYYNKNIYKMLDVSDAPQAEKIAEELLQEKLNAYHISPQDTSFLYTDFRSVTYTNDKDNEWNNWCLSLYVNPKELDGTNERYCPLAVVKAHELGHIMQRMPGEKENYKEILSELAPTIELIVMQDVIYKKMNNIPLEEEVHYPISSPNEINMGKIANTFRTIKEEKNLRSYEDVLLTSEANRAINQFVTKKAVSNALLSSMSYQK